MLLQNITLNNQYPYRRCGATATNTETGYMPSQHGLGGPRQFARFTAFGKGAGFPSGYNPGMYMPLVHSWMSSAQGAVLSISAEAAGLMGTLSGGSTSVSVTAENYQVLPLDTASPLRTGSVGIEVTADNSEVLPLDTTSPTRTGTAGIEITAEATGELKVSGSGSASLEITASADGIGVFPGAGSAEVAITVANATLGAIADVIGLATLSMSGSLTPYAVGHMSGSTGSASEGGELTAEQIAQAVWSFEQ
jgi:hypothetical protein